MGFTIWNPAPVLCAERGQIFNSPFYNERIIMATINTPAASKVSAEAHTVYLYVSACTARLIDAFDKLAATIGTTRGTLLWHAIEHTLAHPPSEPKVTATLRTSSRVGSSPGLWLIRKTDDKGKVVGIELREVLAQSAASGQNFYRYRKGDMKGRDRLLDACRLTADKEAKAFSLPDFEFKPLEGKELEAALTPHLAPPAGTGATNAPALPKGKGK
jgi:hypothetical protein